MLHYLDNSATTPLCQEAVAHMTEYMQSDFGNPSSLHMLGINAQIKLDKCREAVARRLGCDLRELYFTSCGSESNNTAVLGAARAKKRDGKRIVTTAIEHHSILECMKLLESEGFEVTYLSPDSSGNISEKQVFDAVTEDTVLVSMMAVNNETGAVMPTGAIKRAVTSAGSHALIHIDAVQAFGKIDINPAKLGADLISVSAHKIHGPKGIGALYIRKGARILPLIVGGGQERGMRSGTESTLLAEGFAAAVTALPDIKKEYAATAELNEYLRKKLNEIDCVTVNSPDNALPYVLNFSVDGIRSETMLHHLERSGVYVSSGSACAKGQKSHVLRAQGLDDRLIDSALRVSFSRFSTAEDVDALVDGITSGINQLTRSHK